MNTVAATNDDAATSKLYCVKKKYYRDDFVKYFVREPQARPPLINRGYYSRVAAFRSIIRRFLEKEPDEPKQIVNLGAGFDTNFFHFKTIGLLKQHHSVFELDLPEVVVQKVAIILRQKALRDLIFDRDPTSSEADLAVGQIRLTKGNYHLQTADLTDLPAVSATLESLGIVKDIPTLFLSECVLNYLKPSDSDPLIRWAAETFKICSFVTYEQIEPNDNFGRMMIQNLEKRGCPLLGIYEYPTLAAQQQRYISLGWDRAEVATMYDIYNNHLDKADKGRIERLELFDEFEEWELIQNHYCIGWAFRDVNQQFWEGFGFSSLPSPP